MRVPEHRDGPQPPRAMADAIRAHSEAIRKQIGTMPIDQVARSKLPDLSQESSAPYSSRSFRQLAISGSRPLRAASSAEGASPFIYRTPPTVLLALRFAPKGLPFSSLLDQIDPELAQDEAVIQALLQRVDQEEDLDQRTAAASKLFQWIDLRTQLKIVLDQVATLNHKKELLCILSREDRVWNVLCSALQNGSSLHAISSAYCSTAFPKDLLSYLLVASLLAPPSEAHLKARLSSVSPVFILEVLLRAHPVLNLYLSASEATGKILINHLIEHLNSPENRALQEEVPLRGAWEYWGPLCRNDDFVLFACKSLGVLRAKCLPWFSEETPLEKWAVRQYNSSPRLPLNDCQYFLPKLILHSPKDALELMPLVQVQDPPDRPGYALEQLLRTILDNHEQLGSDITRSLILRFLTLHSATWIDSTLLPGSSAWLIEFVEEKLFDLVNVEDLAQVAPDIWFLPRVYPYFKRHDHLPVLEEKIKERVAQLMADPSKAQSPRILDSLIYRTYQLRAEGFATSLPRLSSEDPLWDNNDFLRMVLLDEPSNLRFFPSLRGEVFRRALVALSEIFDLALLFGHQADLVLDPALFAALQEHGQHFLRDPANISALLLRYGRSALPVIPATSWLLPAPAWTGLGIDREYVRERWQDALSQLEADPDNPDLAPYLLSPIYAIALAERDQRMGTTHILDRLPPDSPLWSNADFFGYLVMTPLFIKCMDLIGAVAWSRRDFCEIVLDQIGQREELQEPAVRDALLAKMHGSLLAYPELRLSAFRWLGEPLVEGLSDAEWREFAKLLANDLSLAYTDDTHQRLWPRMLDYLRAHRTEPEVQELLGTSAVAAYLFAMGGPHVAGELCPHHLQETGSFWECVVRRKGLDVLSKLPPHLREDALFVLQIVPQINAEALQYFGESVRRNAGLALFILKDHPEAIQWFHPSLWADAKIRALMEPQLDQLPSELADTYRGVVRGVATGEIGKENAPDQLQPMPAAVQEACQVDILLAPDSFTKEQAYELLQRFIDFMARNASPHSFAIMAAADEFFRGLLTTTIESLKHRDPSFELPMPEFNSQHPERFSEALQITLTALQQQQPAHWTELVEQVAGLYKTEWVKTASNINTLADMLAVPKDPQKKLDFYDQIKRALRAVVHLLAQKRAPSEAELSHAAQPAPLTDADLEYWRLEWLQALSAAVRCAGAFNELDQLHEQLSQSAGAQVPPSLERFLGKTVREQSRVLIDDLCRGDKQSVHARSFLKDKLQLFMGIHYVPDHLPHSPDHWHEHIRLRLSPAYLVEETHSAFKRDEGASCLFDAWALEHAPQALTDAVEEYLRLWEDSTLRAYANAHATFARDCHAYQEASATTKLLKDEIEASLRDKGEDVTRFFAGGKSWTPALIPRSYLTDHLEAADLALYDERCARYQTSKATEATLVTHWASFGIDLQHLSEQTKSLPLEEVAALIPSVETFRTELLHTIHSRVRRELLMGGIAEEDALRQAAGITPVQGLYSDGAPHTSRGQIARVFRALGIFKQDWQPYPIR